MHMHDSMHSSPRVHAYAGFHAFHDSLHTSESQVNLKPGSHKTMYALGKLRRHGLSGPLLWEVTRATFIARLTYASQAWWGLLDEQGRSRLEGVLKKAMKGGFLPKTHPAFAQICDSADERMFGEILRNPGHTLHHLLPPINHAKSRLRTRAHDLAMPSIKGHALSLSKRSFINRMLMVNSY